MHSFAWLQIDGKEMEGAGIFVENSQETAKLDLAGFW
jgi:hypothetical protein